MKKHQLTVLLFILLPFLLSACGLQVKTKSEPDGGVYRTVDSAANWENHSAVVHTGDQAASFNGTNVEFLYMDPSDRNTIFASTREQGLLITWDGAASWRKLLTDKGLIVGVGVNSSSPCIIYAATAKDVFKTIDCGRNWQSVFYEKRDKATINTLVMDSEDPTKIFLGIGIDNKGEVVWSQDEGMSWQVIKANFTSPVTKLFINPKNSRIIYAALKKGFHRSPDKGVTWEDLTPRFKELDLKNADEVYNLSFLPGLEDGFITVSKYGLLRSDNSGVDWQAYILLQQPNSVTIRSFVLNHNNTDEMYYGTDKGLYRTVDGGSNWITLAPPTGRSVNSLLMDPEFANVVYLGAWSPAK